MGGCPISGILEGHIVGEPADGAGFLAYYLAGPAAEEYANELGGLNLPAAEPLIEGSSQKVTFGPSGPPAGAEFWPADRDVQFCNDHDRIWFGISRGLTRRWALWYVDVEANLGRLDSNHRGRAARRMLGSLSGCGRNPVRV